MERRGKNPQQSIPLHILNYAQKRIGHPGLLIVTVKNLPKLCILVGHSDWLALFKTWNGRDVIERNGRNNPSSMPTALVGTLT